MTITHEPGSIRFANRIQIPDAAAYASRQLTAPSSAPPPNLLAELEARSPS